jgi:hypothetical protein
MSEKSAYLKYRKAIKVFKDRIQRIENLMIIGMPDVNQCLEGCECWIEIKSPKEPKRSTTPLFGSNHKVSTEQKNWFLDQKNAGGVGWLLICTDKRWMLIDGCIYADFVNEMTVDELISISTYWFALQPNGDVPKMLIKDLRTYLIWK